MKTPVDTPGRYFALTVFSPLLMYSGMTVRGKFRNIGYILMTLSVLLFVYELYWVTRPHSP